MSTAVVALILKNKSFSTYLIVRRNQAQSGAGFWEFPGGKVEPDETPEVALRREINEELHVQIDISKLKFVFQNHHEYSDKSIIISFYLYEVPQELPLILIDHDDFKWCDIQTVLEYPIAAADIPVIKHLQERQTEA